MPDKKIKAILFDLGETVLNFGKINTTKVFHQSAESTYKFLQSCNQPVGGFKWYYLHSIMAIRLRCLLSGITGKDFNALSLLKKIGMKKGFTLAEDQWRHLGWLWYEPLARLAQIEPETKQTLSVLKQMGLKLGIVSNTFISAASLDNHLGQLGLLDFFQVRLYSYEFNFRKPDTRIFKAAAQRIGETLENILFVGDRIDKDIKPAIKAGMVAALKVAYTNTGKKIPQGVWQISRLSELPALVKKINMEREEQMV